MVEQLAVGKAAADLVQDQDFLAALFDGLEIEVHSDPAHALSDGAQSLNFEHFDDLMQSLKPYAALSDKKL